MASKKTAVALASVLTFISTAGVKADLVVSNPADAVITTADLTSASQISSDKTGSGSSEQAAKTQNPQGSLRVMSPLLKKKEPVQKVELEPQSNLGLDLALKTVDEQVDVQSTNPYTAVSKADTNVKVVNNVNVEEDCQAQSDADQVANSAKTEPQATEMLLAQISDTQVTGEDGLTQTEGEAEAATQAELQIEALVQKLAPSMGGADAAEESILTAIDNLSEDYTEAEIISQISQEVDAGSTDATVLAAKDQADIDAAQKKLKESNDNLAKLEKDQKDLAESSETTKKELEKITQDKKEAQDKADKSVTDQAAAIDKQTALTVKNGVDDVKSLTTEILNKNAETNEASQKAMDEKAELEAEAKAENPMFKPKTSDTAKSTQDELNKTFAADSDLVKDLSNIIVEQENTTDSATRQGYEINSGSLAGNQIEDVKKAEQQAVEDRKTNVEQAMLAEHFVKVAKRSKAFFLAISEQQALEPRIRGVENAVKAGEDVIGRNINVNAKVKGREGFVMRESEIVSWLEILSEALYKGVGIPRTKAFQLAKLTPLYPPSRFTFDYKEMIYRESFNDMVDDLANQKAYNMAINHISAGIVDHLKNAPGENYEDAQITINDYLSKMFLDSTKGSVDTIRHAYDLFDHHYRTVSEDPDSVSDLKVEKSFKFAETQKDLIMEEYQEIKADFSLYSTFAFLTDELTASFELISEKTALDMSDITPRLIRTEVNSDIYQIRLPTDSSAYIEAANASPIQTLWANQTINMMATP